MSFQAPEKSRAGVPVPRWAPVGAARGPWRLTCDCLGGRGAGGRSHAARAPPCALLRGARVTRTTGGLAAPREDAPCDRSPVVAPRTSAVASEVTLASLLPVLACLSPRQRRLGEHFRRGALGVSERVRPSCHVLWRRPRRRQRGANAVSNVTAVSRLTCLLSVLRAAGGERRWEEHHLRDAERGHPPERGARHRPDLHGVRCRLQPLLPGVSIRSPETPARPRCCRVEAEAGGPSTPTLCSCS